MIATPVQVVLGVAIGVLVAAPAVAGCPDEDDRLLFHSCHGPATIELLLLPEESAALDDLPPGESLTVTGGYTGTDRRADGRPNPVGLFVDEGRVVSPNLARMDGILIIGRNGRPGIHRATLVPLRGGTADLTDPDQRLDFADRAAEQGLSVLQSHLLIADGRLDVRQLPDAAVARRRMLFTGEDGWGVYRTANPVTLFDAAYELQQRHRPDMAINLDMGSYDYCVAVRGGAVRNCGVVSAGEAEKLSNLLRLTRPLS